MPGTFYSTAVDLDEQSSSALFFYLITSELLPESYGAPDLVTATSEQAPISPRFLIPLVKTLLVRSQTKLQKEFLSTATLTVKNFSQKFSRLI